MRSEEFPEVSIVVPTYNRPGSLAVCLRALAALAYPRHRYEVIIVDDGGIADLGPAIDPVRQQIDVKLVQCSHGGVSTARNAGLKAANGKLVAFTDDDCVPHERWLVVLAHTCVANRGTMIGGRTLNSLGANQYSEMAQHIVDAAYAYYNADSAGSRFFASNNLAAPRKELIQIGGFDENFKVHAAEDRDLCDRWSHSGRGMVYADKAIVDHAHPLDFASFIGLYLRHGRGAYHYHALRQLRASGHPGDMVYFRRHLGRHISKNLYGRGLATRLSTWALLSVWQAADLAGFCYEAVSRRGYTNGRAKPCA